MRGRDNSHWWWGMSPAMRVRVRGTLSRADLEEVEKEEAKEREREELEELEKEVRRMRLEGMKRKLEEEQEEDEEEDGEWDDDEDDDWEEPPQPSFMAVVGDVLMWTARHWLYVAVVLFIILIMVT